jgi:hypothetical protein
MMDGFARGDLRNWLVLVAVFFLPCSTLAEGYVDRLWAARPAAALLLQDGQASEWLRAKAIEKDAAGFMIFAESFPRKSELSQNDFIRCIDQMATLVAGNTRVSKIVTECKKIATHK